MKLRRFALLPLLFLGLVLPLCAKDAPRTLLEKLPEQIAGCARGELHDYGTPGLRVSLGYNRDGLAITIYAYDLDHKTIADGVEDPTVLEAFRMAKRDVETALQRGQYTESRLLVDGRGEFGPRAFSLQAHYELTYAKLPAERARVFSEIHVFGAWNHIFKLRITGDRNDQEELIKVIEQFLPEFFDRLQRLKDAPGKANGGAAK